MTAATPLLTRPQAGDRDAHPVEHCSSATQDAYRRECAMRGQAALHLYIRSSRHDVPLLEQFGGRCFLAALSLNRRGCEPRRMSADRVALDDTAATASAEQSRPFAAGRAAGHRVRLAGPKPKRVLVALPVASCRELLLAARSIRPVRPDPRRSTTTAMRDGHGYSRGSSRYTWTPNTRSTARSTPSPPLPFLPATSTRRRREHPFRRDLLLLPGVRPRLALAPCSYPRTFGPTRLADGALP
jgi:hypothetical protein